MTSHVTTLSVERPVLAFEFARDTIAAKVVLVVAGAIVTALSAQLVIPMWPAPITAQTLSVLVVGAGLGARLGLASMLLYLAMGLAGLPVFADANSGVDYALLGPTVGYLVSFPMAAWLMGRLAQQRLDRTAATAAMTFGLGVVVILVGGAVGFVFTLDHDLGQALWAQRLYLPGELLKGAIATLGLPLAWKATRR